MTSIEKSGAWFERAEQVMPGGVSSPVRAFRAVGGHPIFLTRGTGARVWDVDGNEYIDFVGSCGALILGHAHPEVLRVIQSTAQRGTTFGTTSEIEVLFAEYLCKTIPHFEQVRFVSSGTEATMSALRVARGFTGRDKIIKIDGAYHGHADFLLARAGSGLATLSTPDSAGVPKSMTADTLVIPWNDLGIAEALFTKYPNDIAAVIIEPILSNMGVIPPKHGYLPGLSKLCQKYGTLLIFDEVITGFRVVWGGSQSKYGVIPDLTCFGKIMGGGLPAACFGGRRDVMQTLAPSGTVYQAGTLSGNPLALATGLKTFEILSRTGTYEWLEQLGTKFEEGFLAAAQAAGVLVCINRVGSMVSVFFHPGPVVDATSARKADTTMYARFFHAMLRHGVYLPPSQFETIFISLAHRKVDMDHVVAIAHDVFQELARPSTEEKRT